MIRLLTLSILVMVAAAAARGQDDMTTEIYASVENNLRREYDELMRDVLFGKGGPAAKTEKYQNTMKVIYHNKAVMFAVCAGEAERYRSPQATRVPAQRNLALNTCVEMKFRELNAFSQCAELRQHLLSREDRAMRRGFATARAGETVSAL